MSEHKTKTINFPMFGNREIMFVQSHGTIAEAVDWLEVGKVVPNDFISTIRDDEINLSCNGITVGLSPNNPSILIIISATSGDSSYVHEIYHATHMLAKMTGIRDEEFEAHICAYLCAAVRDMLPSSRGGHVED